MTGCDTLDERVGPGPKTTAHGESVFNCARRRTEQRPGKRE
jgi:hypothetical protein